MKQNYKFRAITILAFVIVLNSCQSNNSASESDSMKTETAISETESKTTSELPITTTSEANLDILKTYNGKYPYKVKLFENKAFAERLEKLVGKRYSFLKSVWAVETPMEVSEKQFVASACEAHNCGATNFIVVIDFEKNVMFAGIREEDNVETYSEDGTYPQVMMSWREGDI